MKIAIAGLGLIGGSFAKAIAARTRHRAAGYDLDPNVAKKAFDSGLVEEIGLEGFGDADIVLVALYPNAAVEFLKTNAERFKESSIIIDLCGVKRFVTDEVKGLFKGSAFIGGHPMAGRELSGFSASMESLFDGASMILTPGDEISSEVLLTAENFFLALGFSKITVTTPERHDEMIAFTSQMAHIVSSAYAQNPIVNNFDGFSAGSFADMTRVARLNEVMWTELFMLNRDYLKAQLDILIGNLEKFRSYICEGDGESLSKMLREGSEIKKRLSGENQVS